MQARAEAEVAAAAVLVAEKELDIRQLDVDDTETSAPIAGIAERSPFDVGDLLGGGTSDASRLTTIVDDSRVNVSFFVADRVFLRSILQADEDGRVRHEDRSPSARAPCWSRSGWRSTTGSRSWARSTTRTQPWTTRRARS
ncbi:MAG: hypothetical protein AAF235_06720 [Planctomycetota bacterium]